MNEIIANPKILILKAKNEKTNLLAVRSDSTSLVPTESVKLGNNSNVIDFKTVKNNIAASVSKIADSNESKSGILPDDGGMWAFNNLPLEHLEKKYGVKITPEWVNHVKTASVRFPNGSGSFISPDGLVITNHHVGADHVQNVSTEEKNYMKNGFYAKTKAEELKCPGLDLRELMGIEEMTEQVNSAVSPDMTPEKAEDARKKKIAEIEKEYAEKTGLLCEMVNLYSGGKYDLYQYKRYDDVRLVFAPEKAIAFYGGDPANFTYPRHDLDICIFRVYENNKPIKSPAYFKMSENGAAENQLTFVSGHPGSTGRLLTIDQLAYLRDHGYPYNLEIFKRQQTLLTEFGKQSPEHARRAEKTLFSVENSLKAITGYRAGLLNPDLMAKKAKEEAQLKEDISNDPQLKKEVEKAWDDIKKAQASRIYLLKPYSLLEQGKGFWSNHFGIARNLVRYAEEKNKPNGERLKEFRDSNLPALLDNTLSSPPIYNDLELTKLTDSLKLLKEQLGDSDESVQDVLQGKSPEEAAKELISGTKLGDVAERKKYIDGGMKAITESNDPFIKLALLVDPMSREVRKYFEDTVESVENKNGGLIANAMFKLRGTSIPPDATFTLRLSFGQAKGYEEDGKQIHFHTTLKSLYEESEKHGNKPPWELPPRYLERKDRLNLNTPLDFVSTADSIGGNSGSPVLSSNANFIGILFDGNIQSLPDRFCYTDKQARSVMVDSRAILEILPKLYDAQNLIAELTLTQDKTIAHNAN